MNIKQIIVVWDDENYCNRAEAEQDGAVSEYEIPEGSVGTALEHHYVEVFVEALAVAGERLCDNKRRLAFALVTLKPHTITGKVLEWNDYTVEVWAEDEKTALDIVKDGSLVSHKTLDVSYGTEGAPRDIPITEKDIEIG